MKRASQAGRFFLLGGACYLLLIYPWPGVGAGYAGAYRGVCNVVFESVGWNSKARFEALDDPSGTRDSRVVISTATGDGTIKRRSVSFHTRRTGYVPTAELLALVLATPIPWRRRWKKAVWGILGISLFIAVETGVTILYSMTGTPPIISVVPATSSFFEELYNMSVASPTVSLIVPVLIWILVCVPVSGILDGAPVVGTSRPGGPAVSLKPSERTRG
ncbi:MAG: hypothetical protein HOP29_15225 [Phycisphaerales bacterium]|nr:hypothetical protein [Phycisphaerales bacterium]